MTGTPRTKTLPALALLAALLAPPAQAQDPHPGPPGHAAHHHPSPGAAERSPDTPYRGWQTRTIKALSEAQVADLREGKGLSQALPAELNGYPGPMHVLELADALQLSADQRERTTALLRAMRSEARAAGERVIAAEQALEALFQTRRATRPALLEATTAAGLAQARLREVHLRHHIDMLDLLSADQVSRYLRLRGY